MTNVPEVKLAREAELCYATLALVTDYDVWHETEAEVTVEAVVANLMKNVATAKERPAAGHPAAPRAPDLRRARGSSGTRSSRRRRRSRPSARRRLDLLIGKYFPPTPPAPTARPRRAGGAAPTAAARGQEPEGEGAAPWLTSWSRARWRSTTSARPSARSPTPSADRRRSSPTPPPSSRACKLVAVVGHDFPKEHLELLAGRGVDLAGVQVTDGATFRWTGEYGYDLNEAQTLDTRLGVLADFKPELPGALPPLPVRLPGQPRPGDPARRAPEHGAPAARPRSTP